MSRGHEQLLHVLSRGVLLSALLAVACDSPETSRHAVLGDWTFLGEGGVDLAELKFFPNGRCRLTQGGQKMLFCGWDPAAEEASFEMRFGPVLPIHHASGTVTGEEMVLTPETSGAIHWVRAGSQHEQSVRAYLRGQALFDSGEIEKAFAEWESAADHGDALIQNNLAWFLATWKDPKLHDGKKAVAYAEKAVAQERIAMYLDTLAAALARDGQFERAIQVQEEALSLITKESAAPVDQAQNVKQYTERLALYKAGQAYTER